MLVSIAEEMNPTRRNTMEDAHVVHPPGSWGAPDSRATFLGVYDGHGGRLIADYLEDHLAENVSKEWEFAEGEQSKQEDARTDNSEPWTKNQHKSKNRHICHGVERDGKDGSGDETDTIGEEGRIVRTALERAFLLTDIQSRMDGISTSGATVACCVVAPRFSPRGDRLESISIHAANAGDARAVLSTCTARPSKLFRQHACSMGIKCENCNSPDDSKHRRGEAVRITHDHKSTDPREVARIESSGGIMIRGRVLGVLAVARSLGDHGLKEYVIGRPHVSSTAVRIEYDCSNALDGDGADKKEFPKSSCLVAPFTDGEFLIVACDGLWDVMEDQEAVDFVWQRVTANAGRSDARWSGQEEVASLLIEEALRRGSTDNVTVIVYWL